MYRKSKKLSRTFYANTALKICQQNPLPCSFSLQFIFFSKRTFYEDYSTSDSHTNTACLLVKMASKTVITPIDNGFLVNYGALILKSWYTGRGQNKDHRFRRCFEDGPSQKLNSICGASKKEYVTTKTTTLFFVQKYKSWIVCPANSWKASRDGA